jgi:hypothetical protein
MRKRTVETQRERQDEGRKRLCLDTHPTEGLERLRGASLAVAKTCKGKQTYSLVSYAVLVGRSRQQTGQSGYWRSPLYPLAPILGLILAVAFGIADLLDADAGRPSLLLLGSLVVAALLWHQFAAYLPSS